MAAKRKKITQHRQELANALAEGKKSVEVIGYQSGNVNAAIASPEVARAVKAGLVRRLIAEAAPLSLGLLIRAVKAGHAAYEKKEQATTAQLDAARALMGMAGLQAASEEMRLDKDPGEMSGAELEEALRKAEDARAELARRGAIEAEGRVSAPSDAPEDSQVADKAEFLFS